MFKIILDDVKDDQAMTSSDDYYELLGREVVSTQLLGQLRGKLKISRSFMSELLQASPATYRYWEMNPATAALMWPSTAIKIGRFYVEAVEILNDLELEGIKLDDLMPFHRHAELLGRPLEQLIFEFRDGNIRGEDLGILGIWVYHDQSVEAAA